VDAEEEAYLAALEDKLSTPRTIRCRRVLRCRKFRPIDWVEGDDSVRDRLLGRTVRKQNEGLDICKWGCGEWVTLGNEQERHEKMDCIKRIANCKLGCPAAYSLEKWHSRLGGCGFPSPSLQGIR
jgi:hypothetical protein